MTYYLVMKIIPWENVETDSPIMQWPVKFGPAFGKGFCAIYESMEEAEKWHPGETIVKVRETLREKEKAK